MHLRKISNYWLDIRENKLSGKTANYDDLDVDIVVENLQTNKEISKH